jgi:hypothetical protein
MTCGVVGGECCCCRRGRLTGESIFSKLVLRYWTYLVSLRHVRETLFVSIPRAVHYCFKSVSFVSYWMFPHGLIYERLWPPS